MLQIYTDGSCSPNPGPGGAGLVMVQDGKMIKEVIYSSPTNTTNNQMELHAVIMSFENLPKGPVTIFTDSTYVKNGINDWIHNWEKRGWLTAGGQRVKNCEQWKELLKLTRANPNVTIEWIKGHAGNRWNERADVLATRGARGEALVEEETLLTAGEEQEINNSIDDCEKYIKRLSDLNKALRKPATSDAKKLAILNALSELQIFIAYLTEAENDVASTL